VFPYAWLERTYSWVPRFGIDRIRAVVVDDAEGIAARLDADIQEGVRGTRGPGAVPHVAAADAAAAGASPVSGIRSSTELGSVEQIPVGEVGRTSSTASRSQSSACVTTVCGPSAGSARTVAVRSPTA
jgi:hypothetical protein